jgi:sporulation protein YlmC with PRC-barrel domain
MILRTISLGSAAAACLLLAAAPSLAQGDYSHDSTPAERAQTEALNNGAANDARSNTNVSTAAQDDYDAARAAYEINLNNYDIRKAAYDNDRARYEDQRHDYDRDRMRRWSTFPDRDRYHDIMSLHTADLVGMTVSTQGGMRIGRITNVGLTADGRIDRIAIAVRNDRIAWLYADDVRYDPQSRAILIDLSEEQVDRLAQMHQPGS